MFLLGDIDDLIDAELREQDRRELVAKMYMRAVRRSGIPPTWIARCGDKEEALAIRLWDMRQGLFKLSSASYPEECKREEPPPPSPRRFPRRGPSPACVSFPVGR